MAEDVLRHLLQGFIRLHVLYHVVKEPLCGTEMMEELRHHGYEVGPGTLYPALHQMQQAGLIRAQLEIVGGKRAENYRATPLGKKLLSQSRIKLRELAAEILDDQDGRQERRKK